MARKTKRSKSKKKKSNPPALRTLVYQLTGGASGATQTDNYIDLAYGLSLVNRRLYEQGRQYHIKRIQVIPFAGSSPATYSFIEAEVLPTHWSMYAAYKKTKDLWKQMRTGRGGAPGSGLPEGLTPATWADFKIYSSEQHYDARATVNVPLDGDGSSVSTTGAEWVYSTFNMPDDTDSADEFTVHMIGDDSGSDESWNSVGMIKGYAESRRTVQVDDSDAGIQTSTWMINLFDDGDTLDEVAASLRSEGDAPPYDIDDYAGAETNMPTEVVAGRAMAQPVFTAGDLGPVNLGSMVVPCGLLNLRFAADKSSLIYKILIEFKEGPYKGVLAPPM